MKLWKALGLAGLAGVTATGVVIARDQRKRAEVNKELKDLRKNLRRDVDALETTAKWANILAMPIGVSLAGIVIAIMKNKRTAAK